MKTATFKGLKDGTPSGGVATRYGADSTYLELPIGVPVGVEKESLAAAKALSEEKVDGQLLYDIEITDEAPPEPPAKPANGEVA